MSNGFNPIHGWQPLFITGTAYTVSVPVTLDAGTPVESLIFPVGCAYSDKVADVSAGGLQSGDPRQKLSIGCNGFELRTEFVGSAADDVTLDVIAMDPHDQSFEPADPAVGVTYNNNTNPYKNHMIVTVEDVGSGCKVKYTRVANTGNLTVAAWIRRFRYYD